MTAKRGTRPKGIRPADLETLPSDWRLVRVGREKEPIAGKGWFDVDDYSPDDALGMNGSGPPAWGLKTGPASGVLVLDLDAEGWRESFQKETGHPINDLPQTISWSSGKPGRSGHAFAVDREWWDSLANRRSWENSNGQTAWELRWDRCQSVILGAHPETDGYRWLPERSPADIPDPAQAPDWLLECLLVQELEAAVAAKPSAEDAKRAQAMLVCLPPGEFTAYEAWLRIGMALHHTDAGLLSAWVDWCRPMHNFDEAECLAKWKSFGNGHKGRPATIGTLHFLAKQHGYSEPKGSRQSSKKTRERNASHPHSAPYRALGWCELRSRIYYQHRETGQIASIKPAAQAGPLLQLAPIAYWESTHPGRSGVDWTAACSVVIEQANRAGVFALDHVRGRGLWQEGNQIVWHLGDRLEVDGKPVSLIDHRSAHHYPRLPALEVDPSLPPLSDAEGKLILDAVAAMGWSSPLDPIHLLGWSVLANVGGALDKRPVLQLTSRFGSGKTYTRERVLVPLLAGLAISRSNSTEAGIRQLLKADSLPVLIDESEGEDHSRREGHLRLARLSYDGSPTDRGTTYGQAHSYVVRSSVALVGINAMISNPAERSRTVVVGREQLPQGEWTRVDRHLEEVLTAQTGARLLRRAISNLSTLRANVATFRRAVEGQLGGGAAARAGDTYGALLAGAHLLQSTAELDDEQALDWLDTVGWNAAEALGESCSEGQESTAESKQCLAMLLSHEETWRIDTGTGRLSVRELLELARSPSRADDAEQARKALGRRGIRATDTGIDVANSAEALAPIYGRTKWRDGGHRARLRDLPGSFAAGQVRFPVLGSSKATKVIWKEVLE
ncbi:MAG: PriCT-2 domain-containing protein [Cyanobacteriota bacterium]|jgi:hypothetical protein